MAGDHNEGSQKDMKHQDDVEACDTDHLPTRKTESDEPITEPCTHDIMEEATEKTGKSKSPILEDIEAPAINNGYIIMLPSDIKVGECCTQNQEETLKNEDSGKEQPEMKIRKLEGQICQHATQDPGYVIMQPSITEKTHEFSTNSNMYVNHNKDSQNAHVMEGTSDETEDSKSSILDEMQEKVILTIGHDYKVTSENTEYFEELESKVIRAIVNGYTILPSNIEVRDALSETCSKDLEKTSENTDDSECSILDEMQAKMILAEKYGYTVLPPRNKFRPSNPYNDSESTILDEMQAKVNPVMEHDSSSCTKYRPSPYINSSRLILQESDAYPYATPNKTKASTVHMPPNDLSQLTLNGREQHSSTSVKSGKDKSPLTAQEELAEIFNDYKNNVHSLSEVEKLVEEWMERNYTSQSFKESLERLNKMREDHAVKQIENGRRVKRPTLFERLMRFFFCGYT